MREANLREASRLDSSLAVASVLRGLVGGVLGVRAAAPRAPSPSWPSRLLFATAFCRSQPASFIMATGALRAAARCRKGEQQRERVAQLEASGLQFARRRNVSQDGGEGVEAAGSPSSQNKRVTAKDRPVLAYE